MSWIGREALPVVREYSGGPTGCPGLVGWSGVVGKPSRMSVWLCWICGKGQEIVPDVRQWSGGPREFI